MLLKLTVLALAGSGIALEAQAPLQDAQTKPAFEVASVRLADPEHVGMGMNGGPGTSDPGRLSYVNVPLYRILTKAYGMMPYEVAGPSWMNDAKYDIAAKIPEGTTAEQIPIMLQNLLVERFHLTMHRETRDRTVYDLTVGKNGSKLKASDPRTAAQAQIQDGPLKAANDGFPVPFPGRSMIMRFSTKEGTLRMSGGLETTGQIAQMLSNYVGAPVVNKTGLTGKYDFHLEFAGDDSPDGTGGLVAPGFASDPVPSIFSAVQDYLGLRLDKTKGALDVFVIDRVDRTPTEN